MCDNGVILEGSVADARQAVLTALAALQAAENSGDGQLVEGLSFYQMVSRQIQHRKLMLVANAERRGEFAERGVRPALAVADILRCRQAEARQMVTLAGSVFPTTLDGQPLEPEFPATAAALATFEIDQAHAEVIEHALHTDAARRIPPEQRTDLETQLAELARQHGPDQLARLAKRLIELLDQDGPAPEDDQPQINELHLAKSRHGVGGRITGRLDAPTFEVLARAIRAHLTPGDGHTSLGERQAAALGEICEHSLDEGRLPAEGGERPHVTMVLDYERLRQQARGVILDYGGQLSAGHLRRMLRDAKITPVVLGGDSQPLDVGPEKRTATLAQRKAVAARDGGCAHPGCDRPAHRCQIHHIRQWLDGGGTDINNKTLCELVPLSCDGQPWRRSHHPRQSRAAVQQSGREPQPGTTVPDDHRCYRPPRHITPCHPTVKTIRNNGNRPFVAATPLASRRLTTPSALCETPARARTHASVAFRLTPT